MPHHAFPVHRGAEARILVSPNLKVPEPTVEASAVEAAEPHRPSALDVTTLVDGTPVIERENVHKLYGECHHLNRPSR